MTPYHAETHSGRFKFDLLAEKLDRLSQDRGAETGGALDDAGLASDAWQGSLSPQSVSIPDPNRLNERVREISAAAGAEQYRLLFVSGGTARHPVVLKEIGIPAADVPEAIRLAFHVEWPPAAIGLS